MVVGVCWLGEEASGSDEGECGRRSFELGARRVRKQGSPSAGSFLRPRAISLALE